MNVMLSCMLADIIWHDTESIFGTEIVTQYNDNKKITAKRQMLSMLVMD